MNLYKYSMIEISIEWLELLYILLWKKNLDLSFNFLGLQRMVLTAEEYPLDENVLKDTCISLFIFGFGIHFRTQYVEGE